MPSLIRAKFVQIRSVKVLIMLILLLNSYVLCTGKNYNVIPRKIINFRFYRRFLRFDEITIFLSKCLYTVSSDQAGRKFHATHCSDNALLVCFNILKSVYVTDRDLPLFKWIYTS